MTPALSILLLVLYVSALDLGVTVTYWMYLEWCRNHTSYLSRAVVFLGWLGSTISVMALWCVADLCFFG